MTGTAIKIKNVLRTRTRLFFFRQSCRVAHYSVEQAENNQFTEEHFIKKFIIFSISAIMVSVCSPLFAAERYFSLSTGIFSPSKTTTVDNSFKPASIDYNVGWALGGAFGVGFDSGLRLENELVYRQTSPRTSGGDLWALAWMLNVWWDARNSSPITPYFGGGFGFGRGHVASPGLIDNSGSGIAYQAGGGLDCKIDQRLSLDVGYRYFGLSDTSSNGGVGAVDLVGSSVLAGLRLRF